ncbi:MAG: DUF934 domain-containing protein [Pseudomonadota bacterium]
MATLSVTEFGVTAQDRPKGEEITLAEWRAGVRPEAGRFALFIPNTEDVEPLADAIARFDAVILEFPDFKDGRAYSQARVLRERLGFTGEIRARGEVLCDQALFMVRAGFTALEIGERDVASFEKALVAYSSFYQPAADGAVPIHRLRAGKRAAA